MTTYWSESALSLKRFGGPALRYDSFVFLDQVALHPPSYFVKAVRCSNRLRPLGGGPFRDPSIARVPVFGYLIRRAFGNLVRSSFGGLVRGHTRGAEQCGCACLQGTDNPLLTHYSHRGPKLPVFGFAFGNFVRSAFGGLVRGHTRGIERANGLQGTKNHFLTHDSHRRPKLLALSTEKPSVKCSN